MLPRDLPLQRQPRPAAGFTLLELVVVMVIIGVSAAIAIPAVQAGRHQREVRRTLQQFVAAVREASTKAVLRRRTVELWISPDEQAYALAMPRPRRTPGDLEEELDREPDELRDDLEIEEARDIVGRIELPESAKFGDIKGGRYLPREVVAIPFFPTGGSGGAEVEFVFERDERTRQSFVITIDPLVSAIDMKDEDS
jgi:prepilin-type N-terminal cleavage/methylation domain-containing protein